MEKLMREDFQVNPRLAHILEVERNKKAENKPHGLPSLFFSVLILIFLIGSLAFFLVADLFLTSFQDLEIPEVEFDTMFQDFEILGTREVVLEGELYQNIGKGFGPVATLSRGELVQVIDSARVGNKELLKVKALSLGLEGWVSPNLLNY